MGDCECSIDMVDGCDVEGPEFMSSFNRKARKAHKCTECSRVIEPGETYLLEKGMWDGYFNTNKTCEDCRSIRDAFFCSYMFGTVRSDFEEQARDNGGMFSLECIASLTPAAKEWALGVIREARRDLRELQKG